MKRYRPFDHTTFLPKQFYFFLVVGCTLASWLFFYYLPAEQKITQYKAQIKNLEAQQQALLQDGQSLRSIKNGLKHSEKMLRATTQAITKKGKSPTEKIASIAKKAQKTKLSLKSCNTKPVLNKKWYRKQNVTYNINGQTEAITKLIQKLGKKGKNIKCKKLFITTMANRQMELELVLQFLYLKKNIYA